MCRVLPHSPENRSDGCSVESSPDSLAGSLTPTPATGYLVTTTFRTACGLRLVACGSSRMKYTPGGSARTSLAPGLRSITFRPLMSSNSALYAECCLLPTAPSTSTPRTIVAPFVTRCATDVGFSSTPAGIESLITETLEEEEFAT